MNRIYEVQIYYKGEHLKTAHSPMGSETNLEDFREHLKEYPQLDFAIFVAKSFGDTMEWDDLYKEANLMNSNNKDFDHIVENQLKRIAKKHNIKIERPKRKRYGFDKSLLGLLDKIESYNFQPKEKV